MAEKPLNKAILLKIIRMFEEKNLQGFLELCDPSCVIRDPHYPRPEMKGLAAIRQGMSWAFRTLKRASFEVHHIWIDGPQATVYVQTHHQMMGGLRVDVPQIFYICWNGDKITRIESFLPYRPGGIPGLVIRLYAVLWRLLGKG